MPEANGLTVVDGVDIKPCEHPVDLTDEKRFSKLKLTRGQKAQLNALVSAVPSISTADTLTKSYILTFPEGIEGVLMPLKRGGYTTTLQNSETGRIVGVAALEEASSVRAVCLNAFSAVSIATGQYFLTEINSKMNMIKLSLDKILEFLYGDKQAELMAEISFVRYAHQNYGAIMEHEQQRVSTIIGLQEARKVAIKDIEFYLADLSSTTITKEQNDILVTVERAVRAKECLELSSQLFVVSNLLEVFYAQNYDKGFLQNIEDEVSVYLDKCDKRMLANFSMLQQALNGHKDSLFKKVDKEALEIRTKQVEEIVEKLSTAQKAPMRELLHTSLKVPERKTNYYLNGDGDVFLKTS